jgi:hypothetical protein
MTNKKIEGYMQSNFSVFGACAKDVVNSLKTDRVRVLAYDILTPTKYGLNGGWTKKYFCRKFSISLTNYARHTKELFEKQIIACHEGYIFYNPRFAFKGTNYWLYRCKCWDLRVAFLDKDATLGELDANGNLKGHLPDDIETHEK